MKAWVLLFAAAGLAANGCAFGPAGGAAGPRYEVARQAAGCKCGRTYIDCNDTCHVGEGGDEGDMNDTQTVAAVVILSALVIGAVVILYQHRQTAATTPGETEERVAEGEQTPTFDASSDAPPVYGPMPAVSVTR